MQPTFPNLFYIQMEGVCIQMETPKEHNRTKQRVRTCQVDFCRAKSVKWTRIYSMTKTKELDHWLELKTDGFEQALRRSGKFIYVCSKHFDEAERVQQSCVGFLRLVEGEVAEFCGDAIVSDCLPHAQAGTSFPEDVKLNQLIPEARDRTVAPASKRDMNTNEHEHIMETAEDDATRKRRTCQMDFCRAKSARWRRIYSVEKAIQLDHWLDLKSGGFEQTLKMTGHFIYVCAKHVEEAELRKQQRIASLLQVGGEIAEFPEPCSVVVNDLQDMVILRTSGPRCETRGVPTRTEEIALRLCYWKCLKSAVDRGLLQIGFPLIGTGLGGYPRSEALTVALDTILAFFEANPVKGLNVSICVCGAGARDVLEFGAILMGNELTFKMETGTVHCMRSTMENTYMTLLGLSQKPRTAYELPTTKIRFPSYVKYWTKEEQAVLGSDYRKRKRIRLLERKASAELKIEPLDEDQIQGAELFRENTVRLLKEEDVEKVEDDEQMIPCLDTEFDGQRRNDAAEA